MGGAGGRGGIREVRDGEKGVLVEDFAVKEPLQEVPRHWSFGKLSESGDEWVGRGRGGRSRPDVVVG